ncbi:hypothetical protein RJT34_23408 [Clitoria ternatea]|uniref:PB1 domain-containing protein n=1 Tax=Clitoria ternatea TaxID=43366 RepID=A0AAN9IIE3_CLITE
MCEIYVKPKQSNVIFRNLGCRCSHSFCSKCIMKQVTTNIQEGISVVSYPQLNCNGVLEFDAYKGMLPKERMCKWGKFHKNLKSCSIVSELSFEESDDPEFKDDSNSAYAVFNEFHDDSAADDMKMAILTHTNKKGCNGELSLPIIPRFRYDDKIQPRTHDNQLFYVGGDTKILAVDRNIKFPAFISKLVTLCDDTPQDLTFKYKLPDEDLDTLISVTNDGPFPPQPDPVKNPHVPSSNVDCLCGLDKVVVSLPYPPSFTVVKFHDHRIGSKGYREQLVYDGVALSKIAFSSTRSVNLALVQLVKCSTYVEGYNVVRRVGVRWDRMLK